jgi:hypothetical protein
MHALRKIVVVGVGLGTARTALADPPSTPSLATLAGANRSPLLTGSPTENGSAGIIALNADQLDSSQVDINGTEENAPSAEVDHIR